MKKRQATFAVLCFIILFTAVNIALAYDSEDYDDKDVYYKTSGGPIPIRNQMPLYLFYLQMAPDRARVAERNEFLTNLDYTVSNITVSAFTPASSLYDVQIDLEVQRITFDLRYGLYDNLEIGLEIPYLGLCSGYLDNFIEGIEDGIGARTPRSRERQGSYEFDYSLRYNSVYLIQEKQSKHGIGDVMFNVKYQLFKESEWYWLRPNISLRSAVKFPTADKDDLLGSGEFDYGVGFLLDKGFFNNRFFIYSGANVAFIERPSFLSDLAIEEQIYSGLLAIEYFFTERFSVIAQVTGNSTPYPYSQTNPLDNEGYDWALGCSYKWKEKTNISWDFAVIENISAASSPDVSFNTGFNWRF